MLAMRPEKRLTKGSNNKEVSAAILLGLLLVAALPVLAAPGGMGVTVPKPSPAHGCNHFSKDLSLTPSPPPPSDDRSIDVLSYDLDFQLDPLNRTITGTVAITMVYLRVLDGALELDLVSQLECTGVNSNSLALPHHQQDESLFITLPHTPAPGDTMTISVAWEGRPPRHGMYYAGLLFRTHDQGNEDPGDDIPIIASISEPWSAHSWWPCKDHPADKAFFKAAVTVPDYLLVVSNGTLIETTATDFGWQQFTWEEEFPMPTYLFSVAASNYVFWEELCPVDEAWPGCETIPLQYYFFPQDSTAAAFDMEPTCQMMQMLTSLVGPYPFRGEKYAQVEIKWAGAMEHTTATSISQYLLTGDREYETVIVHEMAHHWFGNSLTPEKWADIWLNEGFARYSEALWVEHAYGREPYGEFMQLIGRQNHPDLFLGDGTLADPDPILPNILVYDKGAWVLHMLRELIGDVDFFKFLRDYAQDPALVMGSVTTADMIAVAESVSGQNLDSFFTPWLTTDLVPSLQIRSETTRPGGSVGVGPYVRIEINQLQDPLFTMAVPVCLHTACGIINEKITIRNRTTVWRYNAACAIDSVIVDPDGAALFHLGTAPEAALKIAGPIPNPATVLGADFLFTAQKGGSLTVNLYDVRGLRLAAFDGGYYAANSEPDALRHLWHWDGKTDQNIPAAAGVYWLEFLVAGTRQVQKVVLLP